MILVTGASGTVGSELVKKLSRAGVRFRAAFHSPEKAARAGSDGTEAVVLDYADRKTLETALQGVEKLFLVSPPGPDQPELEGNVVEEARRAGVGQIVKSSVWRASEESYAFARWNRRVEMQIEESGIPFTHLRPNSFMQNLTNHFAATIKSQSAFRLPAGLGRVSAIDVRDIADVASRVLAEGGHEGRAYDLSGPEALTYHQMANTLSAILGRKISYVNVTDTDFKNSMTGSGAPEWLADAMIELQHYTIDGQALDVLGSVHQITGHKATSFDQFARDHVLAFK